MSSRRKGNDVVRKVKYAGFTGPDFVIQLEPEDDCEPCMMDCDDPECVGWSNCNILDENLNRTNRFAYHVYECQMKDVNDSDIDGVQS